MTSHKIQFSRNCKIPADVGIDTHIRHERISKTRKSLTSKIIKHLIFYILLSITSVCCRQVVHENSKNNPPNVLLIMVDDLNHMLGCLGDTIVKTPHIDALAHKGTLFTNSYCQFPLCNPSRASMLTGLRPSTIGVTNLKANVFEINPEIVSLPRLFKENGYFTARAGKIFHMGVPDAIAVRRDGKDDPQAWHHTFNAPGFELNSNGYFYNATPWETHQVGTGGAISWLRAEKGDHFQHDFNIASEIIRLMEIPRKKPFFLAAGFIRPHVPLVAPKRFFEMYDSTAINLPPSVENDRKDMPEIAYNTWASNFDLSDEQRTNAIKAYYATISFMDEQVGRILLALEKNKLADNTLIVFASDHGFQLGEHGLWFKNFLFRESAFAPLIIYHPQNSLFQNKKVHSAVELLDVYPTLTKMAKLPAPTNLQGNDLGKVLNNQIKKDYAIIETNRGNINGFAVYTQKWSYMEWDNGQKGKELYHLTNDPYQLNNLIDKPELKIQQDSLRNLLRKHVN